MSANQQHLAFLSLGSNLKPEQHLPAAILQLRELGTVLKTSRVWQSAPYGNADQPDYCNAAVLLRTTYSPVDLKNRLRTIEHELGRRRDPTQRYAPRTIDIDLSLYDDLLLDCDGIRVPDPELFHRPFVVGPLAELSSEYVVPGNGETLSQIATQLGLQSLHHRPEIILELFS